MGTASRPPIVQSNTSACEEKRGPHVSGDRSAPLALVGVSLRLLPSATADDATVPLNWRHGRTDWRTTPASRLIKPEPPPDAQTAVAVYAGSVPQARWALAKDSGLLGPLARLDRTVESPPCDRLAPAGGRVGDHATAVGELRESIKLLPYDDESRFRKSREKKASRRQKRDRELTLSGVLMLGGFALNAVVTVASPTPRRRKVTARPSSPEYADSGAWVAIHLGQFAGVLLGLAVCSCGPAPCALRGIMAAVGPQGAWRGPAQTARRGQGGHPRTVRDESRPTPRCPRTRRRSPRGHLPPPRGGTPPSLPRSMRSRRA